MTDTTTAARPAHTPGPWSEDSGEALNVRAPHGGIVAQLHHLKGRHGMGGRLPDGEAVANARLIAASPTMYSYIAERAAVGDKEAAIILESIHAGR